LNQMLLKCLKMKKFWTLIIILINSYFEWAA
jgi:hypothetical protein